MWSSSLNIPITCYPDEAGTWTKLLSPIPWGELQSAVRGHPCRSAGIVFVLTSSDEEARVSTVDLLEEQLSEMNLEDPLLIFTTVVGPEEKEEE